MDSNVTQMLAEYTRLHSEMDGLYHTLAVRAGLSDSALDILYALCVLGDGCLQRDVCALSFTSKQTIHSSIRKLEQDGLLRLQPGQGREVHIRLTPRGSRLIQEKVLPILDLERQAMACLSPEERESFLRLTRQYISHFRTLIKQGEL
ncbi:MAG: winged helix-turn-helix transcriptional regulator [Lawsonibacter sp.]|nr:winged helix-turn-helix transcriptional regulator [Lawsonibacter sp.]